MIGVPELTASLRTALLWTLGHALWQSAALALAYAAWRAFSPAARLPRRSTLARAAMLVTVASAFFTFASLRSAEAPAGTPSVARLAPEPRPAFGRTADVLPAVPVAGPVALGRAAPALLLLWSAGVIVLAVRLAGGLVLAGRIRRRAVPVTADEALRLKDEMAARLGIRRPVALLASTALDAPATIGWWRPAILLPEGMGRSDAAALAPLLAHEMAHVKAGDYAANLVQLVLDVSLFHCPGVRWLSAELRRLREYRCDDRAVALCADRTAYVRALAGLVTTRPRALGLAAPGAAGPRLVDRLRRLSEGEDMDRPRPLRLAALLALGATLVAGGLALVPASRTQAAESNRVSRGPHGPHWANGGQRFLLPWRPEATCRYPADYAFTGGPQTGRAFHCSPLQLDGRALDWDGFDFYTRGTLRIVQGDPHSPAATPIRFRVRLRRDGRIVEDAGSRFLNQAAEAVDLGDVLAVARPSDEVILEPVDERDWQATRIVPLADC